MRRSSIVMTKFCLVSLLLFVFSTYTLADSNSSLARKIQNELENNPFLSKAKVKMRVNDEQGGFLTIEMYEGDKGLRKLISQGYDINSDQIDQQWLFEGKATEEQRRALAAVRTAIRYIKSLNGVKEILVTATLYSRSDQAQELLNKARELHFANNYTEAAKFLLKVLELEENADAEFILGTYYFQGNGVAQDRAAGIKLLEKAYAKNQPGAVDWLPWAYTEIKQYGPAIDFYEKQAQEGDVNAKGMLARLYATCEDPKFWNGEKALKYALTAYNQNTQNQIMTEVLAAAYARAGRFTNAVQTELRIIDAINKDDKIGEPHKNYQLMIGWNLMYYYCRKQAYAVGMKLDRPVFRVKFRTEPAGSEVFVGDVFIGEAPLELSFPAGDYDLLLKKYGYHERKIRVQIDGSQDVTELPVTLSKK